MSVQTPSLALADTMPVRVAPGAASRGYWRTVGRTRAAAMSTVGLWMAIVVSLA